MNRLLLTSILLCFILMGNATNFANVDSLIKKREFLNAWKALSTLEEPSNKIDVNIKKIDMCLKYFTKSVSHQAFAFTNLKKGKSLIEARREAETRMIPVTPFKIDEIIDSLIRENKKDYRLYKAKGDFYYDIFVLYGKDWKKNQQEVLRQMYTAYKTADENGVNDYISLYALGYFYNLNEQSNQAISYLNQSLALDSTYAPTHYNLAYLYTEKDSNNLALYHAYQAYKGYKYITYKNDAGQMTGSLLGKLGRHEEAITVLLDCDKLIPSSYHTYYYLLNSFLFLDRLQEADITAENMFALDWKSHTINSDMIEIYIKTNHFQELLDFYNRKLELEKFDMEFRGHIQLHLAQAFSRMNKEEKMLEYVKIARESFNICYDSGHPVFRVLNKMER